MSTVLSDTTSTGTADSLIAATKKVAQDVAAKHAGEVDRDARFPRETLAALQEIGAMSAAVPRRFGGGGLTLRELGAMCAALGQGCGSSAMVLAMHHIQVGCIARHASESEFFGNYMRELVARQWLLSSMTSEVGTFGDTRSSICAVELEGGKFVLNKDATTGSYCAESDGILVTCRRTKESPPGDQVLVLVRKDDCRLEQTTTWDTMGMRGTRSPGFRLESRGDALQILPGSYADSSAMTMVPYSHVLWAALWSGIAADTVSKAGAVVRAAARKNIGEVPPSALQLAKVSQDLQAMRHNWHSVADEFDRVVAAGRDTELTTMQWALRFNQLKCAASELGPRIAHQSLQIAGLMGYKNDSPFSLSRQYRDLLSGSLMVSNERISAKSAALLLVVKDD